MTMTPAGWYADPSNPAQQRYWDGERWTAHVAPAPTPAPTPAGYAAPPGYSAGAPGHTAGLPEYAAAGYAPAPAKKKLSGGAIAAIVIGAVILLGLLVIGILAAIAVPIAGTQVAKAADSYAKADASSLGLELAIYYVDNSGPPPNIEVVDGDYVIDIGSGAPVTVPVSDGVLFGTVEGTGSMDWCVWVTATDGDIKNFQYSAQGGLEPGTC